MLEGTNDLPLPECSAVSRFAFRLWQIASKLKVCSLHSGTTFVIPSMLITSPGEHGIFFCGTIDRRLIASVEWFVNGSSFESLTLTDISAQRRTDGRYQLQLTNISVEYNTTEVACKINYTTGPPSPQSEASMLLIQGKFTVLMKFL